MSEIRHGAPGLRDRLSYRQATYAVLAALLLGVCLSLVQIGIDLRSERSKVDGTVLEVMRTVEDSAAQAAYSLDRQLATRVLAGLFQFRPVYSARIADDFGDVLGSRERDLAREQSRWLAELAFGADRRYEIRLEVADLDEPVGTLIVDVDSYFIAQPFMERAVVLLVSGVVRNLLLAAILVTLFHFVLTRPLVRFARSIAGAESTRERGGSIEIPRHHERDELGHIVREFNAVLSERDNAMTTLTRHQESLEELIRERTDEMNRAQTELVAAERLAALGKLVAIVSHELRNPLGTLRNQAAILSQTTGTNPRAQRACEAIERNITRCNALVEDLLDFTRNAALERRQHAVGPWMSTIIDEYDFPSWVTVHHEAAGAFEASFNAEKLRRAVVNVLNNACDAIQSTGDAGVINVSSRIRDSNVLVVVEDSGPGVSPEHRDAVLEPLFSTKDYGVGLGLTIVQQIMTQHGGGMEIRSPESGGTKVTLWFAMSDPSAEGAF